MSIGSSPRMRGALIEREDNNFITRFIPAHAGSTNGRRSKWYQGTVHPRACGEHLNRPVQRSSRFGSSPRMRGARDEHFGTLGLLRFIPAHAGSTLSRLALRGALPVHPRACGEHSGNGFRIRYLPGSSPRMRGAREGRHAPGRSHRFIPAHAGSTKPRRPTCSGNSVHPRACGEHSNRRRFCKAKAGSSPRMRGAQMTIEQKRQTYRFIPAHAGSTTLKVQIKADVPVHPRACGEHQDCHSQYPRYHGSSPRMRGARPLVSAGGCRGRFIPAHAGSTGSPHL